VFAVPWGTAEPRLGITELELSCVVLVSGEGNLGMRLLSLLVLLTLTETRQAIYVQYHVTLWCFHATTVAVGSSKYILHIVASSRVNVTLPTKQGSFIATCRIR
jgi:hypothetical protein